MHPGPSTRTILGFFPHPDDESYSAGGFLALAARNGTRVEILCATRGEAGSWRRGSRHATSDLDELRPRELRNACTILGAERPRFLDLPDGRLWKIDPEPVVRRLKEVLRALAPQVVITLGRDGVYGHEDHLACTDLMTRALAELLSGQNIRLLGAAFPPDLFYPLYRRLKRVRDIPIDRRFTVEPLGTTAEAIDLRVDISEVRDIKLAAIASYGSQLDRGDPYSFLGGGILEKLLDEEWFTVLSGPALPPGSSDPFDAL